VIEPTLCGRDLMGSRSAHRDAGPMAENPSLQSDTSSAGVELTETEYADLVTELETVRASHRRELAERLRDARDFGPAAENDDLHAVLEDAAIDMARIAHLEELLRSASIVERWDAIDGSAGLGSRVLVEDELGATARYTLIGRRSIDSTRHEVTLASPVGRALKGARPGDTVGVELPSGRLRKFTVLQVRPTLVEQRLPRHAEAA
jgi:transcription elongation factor GreA